jgi:eukaryotic-like serine/threonine-protein kinase
MNKRVALVSAIMLVALVVAVVGATEALRLISGGTFGAGGSPISEADVRHSLAAAPSTPATTPGSTSTISPAGSQSASPHPSRTTGAQIPHPGRHSFSGNTVLASCLGSQATLTSWFPASGYSVDGASQGPGRSVWVKFKSASSEITVTVTCSRGNPQFTRSFDERGGGDGGGGRGRGGGGGSGH